MKNNNNGYNVETYKINQYVQINNKLTSNVIFFKVRIFMSDLIILCLKEIIKN